MQTSFVTNEMNVKPRAGESVLCGPECCQHSVFRRLNLDAFPRTLHLLVCHNPSTSYPSVSSAACSHHLSVCMVCKCVLCVVPCGYFFMMRSFVAVGRIQRFRFAGDAFDCDFNSPTSILFVIKNLSCYFFWFHVLITFVFQANCFG